jgi:hypothetical protein
MLLMVTSEKMISACEEYKIINNNEKICFNTWRAKKRTSLFDTDGIFLTYRGIIHEIVSEIFIVVSSG